MKSITVDARGCGLGKTTTDIYPRIKRNQALDISTLLVVPSIALQNQYAEHFSKTHKFVAFNASTGDDETVVQQVINEMKRNDGTTICITHAAFDRLQLDDSIKSKWVLIIDEVFMPFRTVKWKSFDKANARINWSSLLIVPPNTDMQDEETFIPLKIDRTIQDSWTKPLGAFRDLTDPQWDTLARTPSIRALNSHKAASAEFFQTLNINKVTGWVSVHIAAAAFEFTYMAAWFRHNNVNFDIVHQFVKHEVPVKLHLVAGYMSWSKFKQMSPLYSTIVPTYNAYVREFCRDKNIPLVYLCNNSNKSHEKDKRAYKVEKARLNRKALSELNFAELITSTLKTKFSAQKLASFIKKCEMMATEDLDVVEGDSSEWRIEQLSHNVHGMNQYTDFHAVSLESAINPTPEFVRAMKQLMGGAMSERDITRANSSYLYYQVAMRTALRKHDNTEVVHIFALDSKSIDGLGDFINLDTTTVIDDKINDCTNKMNEDQMNEVKTSMNVQINQIDVGVVSARIGRPPKYFTEAERIAGKKASERRSREMKRGPVKEKKVLSVQENRDAGAARVRKHRAKQKAILQQLLLDASNK